MNAAERLGKRLSLMRKQRGLSQREFGRRIGVSQQQAAKLESGRSGYSLATLEKVARSLGLKLAVGFRPGPERRRAPEIDRSEAEEIANNIRWFSRLRPLRRLKAVEVFNRTTKRLQNAAQELDRSR